MNGGTRSWFPFVVTGVIGFVIIMLWLVLADSPEPDNDMATANPSELAEEADNSKSGFRTALWHYREGNLTEALTRFKEIPKDSPESPFAQVYIDSILFRFALLDTTRGEYAKAMTWLLQIEPLSLLAGPAREMEFHIAPLATGEMEQIDFHLMLLEKLQEYRRARTDIHKDGVIRDVQGSSRSFFVQRRNRILYWRGKILSLGTTSGDEHLGSGSVYITIESDIADFKVQYKTFDNYLDDMSAHSLIPFESHVYNQLKSMDPGDEVVFSATIIPEENISMTAGVLTEEELITRPKLIVRFNDLQVRGRTL